MLSLRGMQAAVGILYVQVPSLSSWPVWGSTTTSSCVWRPMPIMKAPSTCAAATGRQGWIWTQKRCKARSFVGEPLLRVSAHIETKLRWAEAGTTHRAQHRHTEVSKVKQTRQMLANPWAHINASQGCMKLSEPGSLSSSWPAMTRYCPTSTKNHAHGCWHSVALQHCSVMIPSLWQGARLADVNSRVQAVAAVEQNVGSQHHFLAGQHVQLDLPKAALGSEWQTPDLLVDSVPQLADTQGPLFGVCLPNIRDDLGVRDIMAVSEREDCMLSAQHVGSPPPYHSRLLHGPHN